MALAVFDIDGTLVRGPSTEKRLFALLLRQGWLKPAQLASFVRFGIARASRLGRQTMKKNKAYLAGLRCTDVEALARDWVRGAARDWWFEPCLARLRRHQAAGDRIVLLSGTPQFVAEALASELGVERVFATRLAARAGLYLSDPPLSHPFGEEKLRLLEELCRDWATSPSEVHAYADSLHDLPVLGFAGHPVAVRPDPQLRAAALAAGWEILGKR